MDETRAFNTKFLTKKLHIPRSCSINVTEYQQLQELKKISLYKFDGQPLLSGTATHPTVDTPDNIIGIQTHAVAHVLLIPNFMHRLSRNPHN